VNTYVNTLTLKVINLLSIQISIFIKCWRDQSWSY